ncbi:MAG: hypothetical protein AAF519_03615 [Bacteroidota bacterium]
MKSSVVFLFLFVRVILNGMDSLTSMIYNLSLAIDPNNGRI